MLEKDPLQFIEDFFTSISMSANLRTNFTESYYLLL